MPESIRIDLHCHSSLSDGILTPTEVGSICADHGVRFAALTDHHTIAGLEEFEAACESLGVGFINGIELSAYHRGREIHLLLYGFDRYDQHFVASLAALNTSRAGNGSAYMVVPRSSVEELIDLAHRSGGIAVLAHPLLTVPDLKELETLLEELSALGLDGVELNPSHADGQKQESLRKLAERLGYVLSAGTDGHGESNGNVPEIGVNINTSDWMSFRDRLFRVRKESSSDEHKRTMPPLKEDNHTSGRMRLLIPMVLPALAVIVLFTVALYGYFLPRFEEALLERKRETIQELARTVWSILDEAEKQVQAGLISLDEAKAQVTERVRTLRYGREGKDYFWLQDLSPRMIMHPYRSDLEGLDLAGFRDPRGEPIFTLFAEAVRQDGAGYVDYVWQWMDDPERLEAKESYVQLFEPWGWVIGTGLYINDVQDEIRTLEIGIYNTMLVITAVLVLLLLLMLRGGLKSEQLRLAAERRLQESNARYASLVKAAAEGVLFVRNRLCVYANPVFLELTGYNAQELPLYEWKELFPHHQTLEPSPPGAGTEVYTETVLRRRDGTTMKCRVALKGTPEKGDDSFVVLVRRAEQEASIVSPEANSLLRRLLNLPSSAAEDITRKIDRAEKPEDVVQLCQKTPGLVRSMLESGAAATAIASMISSITDAATRKFIEIAQSDLGKEPVPFAFVAVGSQGRGEQTLFTDQDNILIYDGPVNGKTADYFTFLSERVCGWLAESGYHDCKAELMASNPKWCQPLEVWKEKFTYWISKAEGREVMNFMGLFDFRCVHGRDELLQSIRAHIQQEVAQSPWFLVRAAQNAVQFKTPLRIFGSIVSGRAVEKPGRLDIKAVLMPIVSYARLYTLKHQLNQTSTTNRLSALRDHGIILPSRCHDLLTAFETLLRLRLRHQSEAIGKKEKPDNLINLSWLGHIDKAALKECFSEIDRIQSEIAKEYLGGEIVDQ